MVPIPAAVAIPLIKEVISAGTQYLACREQEKTKRAAIAAHLEASLTVIEKQYGSLSAVLAENHDMAMEAYHTLSELIRDPSIKENTELFKFVLNNYMDAHKLYSSNLVSFGDRAVRIGASLNRGELHEY